MVGWLRAVGVSRSSELAEALQPRFHALPSKRCWRRLRAQLFEPTARELYSTVTGDSKLYRAVVGALGKYQPVSHAAAANR